MLKCIRIQIMTLLVPRDIMIDKVFTSFLARNYAISKKYIDLRGWGGGNLGENRGKNIECVCSTFWGSWKTMVRFFRGFAILKKSCRPQNDRSGNDGPSDALYSRIISSAPPRPYHPGGGRYSSAPLPRSPSIGRTGGGREERTTLISKLADDKKGRCCQLIPVRRGSRKIWFLNAIDILQVLPVQ